MPDIHPIHIDDFKHMQVDEESGMLYWKGQPVVTEQRFTLNRWLNASIVAGGFATAVIALIELSRVILGI